MIHSQIYDSSEDLWSEITHFIFRKSLECVNDFFFSLQFALLILNISGFKYIFNS